MAEKINFHFSTVTEYLALQPPAIRKTLEELRQTIKKAAPQATEVISYKMPAYKYHGMLAFFAVWKNHYGLYVMRAVLQAFKDELSEYELSEATIRFPLDKPVPKKLVTALIKYGVKINLDRAAAKEAAKSKKIKSKK